MKTRIIGALILSALTLSATACDTPEEIEQGIRQVEEVLGIDIPEDQEAKIITDRLALLEAQRQANALAPEHDYLDLETPAKVISIVAMSPEFNLDQAWVDRYVPWMMKIVLRESAGCYNLRRGGAFATASGAGCVLKSPGFGTDSGYGQVLMEVHHKWLCSERALCTPADVTATPWNSAVAFIALVLRSGPSGWCYTAQLRRGAICRSWPG